jgi:hypothetical protein
MKYILFLVILFKLSFSFAQTDTTKLNDDDTSRFRLRELVTPKPIDIDTQYYVKIDKSFYFRSMPTSICTGGGSLNNNLSIAPTNASYIEAGGSYGMIDIGLAYGSYSKARDTSSFLEMKVTMDASQYGIFSNEFSLGFGRIFHSATPILLEASYTIMAQLPYNIGVGLSTGYYDFVGSQYDISKVYYGLFLRYGLPRSDQGTLMGNRKVRVHKGKRK